MTIETKPCLIAVDDNEDSAELIVRVAKKVGYSAFGLTNPRCLKDEVTQKSPDVITLDLSMPEADGLETLDFLRDANFRGRLIIISGHRECLREHVCTWARTYGFDVAGNLEKPVRLQALSDLLTGLHRQALDHAQPDALAHASK
jgi:CheY-like chemotaxis protein